VFVVFYLSIRAYGFYKNHFKIKIVLADKHTVRQKDRQSKPNYFKHSIA